MRLRFANLGSSHSSAFERMSTVDEEIAELKKIIKGYDDELKNASTMEEKRVLRELIIVSREMVIRLLDEKRASSGMIVVLLSDDSE